MPRGERRSVRPELPVARADDALVKAYLALDSLDLVEPVAWVSRVEQANPELFPWCPANGDCGAVVRRFGSTGHHTGRLGMDDAPAAAWATAHGGLVQGRLVTRRFVIEHVLVADGALAAGPFALRLG